MNTMMIDDVNAELRELAATVAETVAAEFADQIELDALMASSAYYDGSDDCSGPWYWEIV